MRHTAADEGYFEREAGALYHQRMEPDGALGRRKPYARAVHRAQGLSYAAHSHKRCALYGGNRRGIHLSPKVTGEITEPCEAR